MSEAPTGPAGDRIAGFTFLVLGIATAAIAIRFRVGFLTDPIGPRALPWLAAALVGMGGALMLARPAVSPAALPVRPPVALAIGTFVLYAVILSVAGFMLSTALLMMVLARFYGGRWRAGMVAGGIFAVALWLLFAYALGVPLPIGSLFTQGG